VTAVDTHAQSAAGRLSLHLEGILFQPEASGSVFDLTASELGVEAKEYRHIRPSAEIGLRLHRRVSLIPGWSSGSQEVRSTAPQGVASQLTNLEFRNAIWGGMGVHVASWGSSGQWRTEAVGGVGRQSYQFGQTGTFPDASRPGSTLDGAFLTQGKGYLQFAGLRLERALSPRLGISIGGRYQWSKAEVSGDYQGFPPISLSGFGVSTGLRLTP
jgi:hypothetical protein